MADEGPTGVEGMYKGCTRDTQGIPKGTTPSQHRSNTVAIPCQFAVSKTPESRRAEERQMEECRMQHARDWDALAAGRRG
jgi:hypothetical protein